MPVLFFNLGPGSAFLSCSRTQDISPSGWVGVSGGRGRNRDHFRLSYSSGGTIPDVVAGVSAAVAGVVCGETGARLGAVAAR